MTREVVSTHFHLRARPVSAVPDAGSLVAAAARLRWRAPELTLLMADQASNAAARLGSESVRLRAEVLAVFASNQLGRGSATGGRALRAFLAAQAAGEETTERLIRVELAACAADASAPAMGLSVLGPALDRGAASTTTARAAAFVTAADCVARLGGGPEVAALLGAADELYDTSRSVEPDAVLLRRGIVHARLAAYHRRVGDHESAGAAARAGLELMAELGDEDLDSGQVSGSLVAELVLAQLDAGQTAEAVLTAQPVLRRPARPAAALSSCWLRLALVSRVHLPAGRHELARRLLAEAAADAERNQLDSVLAEVRQLQAQVHETCAEVSEALLSVRAAHVAERRWRDTAAEFRTLLAAEFGRPAPAADLRSDLTTMLTGFRVTELPGRPSRAARLPRSRHAAPTPLPLAAVAGAITAGSAADVASEADLTRLDGLGRAATMAADEGSWPTVATNADALPSPADTPARVDIANLATAGDAVAVEVALGGPSAPVVPAAPSVPAVPSVGAADAGPAPADAGPAPAGTNRAKQRPAAVDAAAAAVPDVAQARMAAMVDDLVTALRSSQVLRRPSRTRRDLDTTGSDATRTDPRLDSHEADRGAAADPVQFPWLAAGLAASAMSGKLPTGSAESRPVAEPAQSAAVEPVVADLPTVVPFPAVPDASEASPEDRGWAPSPPVDYSWDVTIVLPVIDATWDRPPELPRIAAQVLQPRVPELLVIESREPDAKKLDRQPESRQPESREYEPREYERLEIEPAQEVPPPSQLRAVEQPPAGRPEAATDREAGRHRSDMAMADLLAEALMAYQDGRRSQLAADSASAEPGFAEPPLAEPGSAEPGPTRSVFAEPVLAEPGPTRRFAAESAVPEPAVSEPTVPGQERPRAAPANGAVRWTDLPRELVWREPGTGQPSV